MVPRLFGTSALSDQVTAGVIMWVPGSLVYLVPATLIAIQYLSPSQPLARPRRAATAVSPLPGAGMLAVLQRKFLPAMRMPAPAVCTAATAPALSRDATLIRELLPVPGAGAVRALAVRSEQPFDLLTKPLI